MSKRQGSALTLAGVPGREWDAIADMGFRYVWLMGVWKRSQAGRRYFQADPAYRSLYDYVLPGWTEDDIIGSPYSIAAYEPDPGIGTWEDIDRVRSLLQRRGIGLILDFVPNHTGPDFPWVSDHPDYYIQGTDEEGKRNPAEFFAVQDGGKARYIAKGKDPYFPPWPDTAQLNYFNPEMRSALRGELKKIAGHCDGVRCDMAMLVLNEIFAATWSGAGRKFSELPKEEFWTVVREMLPGFLLVAEAYWDREWTLQQLGFDYTYDKRLYDRIVSASVPGIYLHLTADISFQRKLTRFIENHDEPRSAGMFGRDRAMAAAVLFATLPGMKLYQHGQFEGRGIRLPLQLRRVKEEESDEEISAFYGRLLPIVKQDIFHKGVWQLKEVLSLNDASFRNLIAYVWKSPGQIRLVVVNFSEKPAQGSIQLREDLAGDRDYLLVDMLNDGTYLREGREMTTDGLHVILEGYKAHIFEISLKR
jgi:glycosidase